MNKDGLDELLEKSYRNEIPFYIFGAGTKGRQCSELCALIEFPIAGFFDNNKNLWGKVIVNNTKCHDYHDVSVERNILCCVCVAKDTESIIAQLKEEGFENVIRYDEFFNSDWVIHRFYNHDFVSVPQSAAAAGVECNSKKDESKGKKVAIYTCVLGGYDAIYLPDFELTEGCDYYIITDNMDVNAGNAKLLHIDSVIPDNLNGNIIKNRYCKMHGNKIFPEYDYSIYTDGHLHIKRDISHYAGMLSEYGIAFQMHNIRKCIYSEGIAVVLAKKGDREVIRQQMIRYMEEGMPRDYGLIAGGLIVRDHNNDIANKIMEEWYVEFMNGEKRDQLSFSYVAWKNNINMQKLLVLNEGRSFLLNDDIEIVRHCC